MDGPPWDLEMVEPAAGVNHRHGWAPMGPRDGWALGRDGPWLWMGPHGPSEWMGLGQGWALGIDGIPWVLGMDEP